MKNKKRIEALEEQVRILISKEPTVSKTESELTELPEKWCIKSAEVELLNYVNKNGVNAGTYTTDELSMNYAHFPPYHRGTTHVEILQGYTKITFDQFKKWVLKEDEKKEARKDTNNAIEEAIEKPSIREVQVKISSQEEANECAEIAKSCGAKIGSKFSMLFNGMCQYFFVNSSQECGVYAFNIYKTEISIQEYRERFGKPKEIDWSKAGQLVEDSIGTVWLTSGTQNEKTFKGVVIHFEKEKYTGQIREVSKKGVKLRTEPIILKNE